MQGLDRRSVLAASAAGAVGLVASSSLAQEEHKQAERDQMAAAPGVEGGEKRASTTKQWYGGVWPGVGALVTYINSSPAQGAGEVQIVRVEQDGTVTALVYM